jgi:hypothetical protein
MGGNCRLPAFPPKIGFLEFLAGVFRVNMTKIQENFEGDENFCVWRDDFQSLIRQNAHTEKIFTEKIFLDKPEKLTNNFLENVCKYCVCGR